VTAQVDENRYQWEVAPGNPSATHHR